MKFYLKTSKTMLIYIKMLDFIFIFLSLAMINHKIFKPMKIIKMLAVGAVALSTVSCVSKNNLMGLDLIIQMIENVVEWQREIQDLKSYNSLISSENNLLKNQNEALKSSWCLFIKHWKNLQQILINW